MAGLGAVRSSGSRRLLGCGVIKRGPPLRSRGGPHAARTLEKLLGAKTLGNHPATLVLGCQWRLSASPGLMVKFPYLEGTPVLMSAAAAPVARRGGLEQTIQIAGVWNSTDCSR